MSTNILNLPTEETLQSIATALTTMQGNVSGVKGNEETTYRTGQVNLTAANIGALSANTTYVTSVNGQSGVITGLATTSDLNTVRLIAEGAGAAVSFATYTAMVSNLNNAAATDYKVGQSIYIATLDVPDLWVFEVSENQILYYYTDDAAFKTLLASQGYVQVGYCKLAALETQKVDLTNHATLNTQQTFTNTKSFTDFSLINDYTNNKTLASYLSGKVDTNADCIFNIINATDIAVSNILTQAQIDVITNGKPTIIKGTFLDYDNPILCSVRTASNYGNRSYVGAWLGSKQAGLATYAVFTIMNTGQIKIEKALIYYNLQASNEMMAYFGDVTASRNLYFNKGYSTGSTLQLGWNNSNIAIESTASTFKVACNNFISRNGTNSSDIGSSTVSWKDLYLGGKINPNSSGYGISLPDTTDFTANKELGLAEGTYNYFASLTSPLDSTQIEIITNGKPTIVDSFSTYRKIILMPPQTAGTGEYVGYAFTTTSTNSWTTQIRGYRIRANGAFAISSKSIKLSDTAELTIDNLVKLNSNASGYGLTLPDTTSWTADKEIATNDIISDAYDNTSTYAVGDCCIYNNTLYKCNTAITTAEDFNSTKWDAITITELISNETIVRTTGDQTVAGKKKFTGTPEAKEMIFRNNVSSPTGSALSIQNDNGYNAKIRFNNRGFMFTAGSVYPTDNNVMDFGATNYLWKNIYVSGNLSDGTNSVPVALLSGVSGAYATNSTTELKYSSINNISISADTTFTLATAPNNTYPEYKAKITNTDTSNAITITLPSGTIVKAESGITVSSNTFTIPADTTVVVSIQDDLALVMIKG